METLRSTIGTASAYSLKSPNMDIQQFIQPTHMISVLSDVRISYIVELRYSASISIFVQHLTIPRPWMVSSEEYLGAQGMAARNAGDTDSRCWQDLRKSDDPAESTTIRIRVLGRDN